MSICQETLAAARKSGSGLGKGTPVGVTIWLRSAPRGVKVLSLSSDAPVPQVTKGRYAPRRLRTSLLAIAMSSSQDPQLLVADQCLVDQAREPRIIEKLCCPDQR